MAQFVEVQLETEATNLAQQVYDELALMFPEWAPADANLEYWIIEGLSRLASDLRTMAVDVSIEIFKEYGRTVVDVPPIEPEAATAESTWTVQDAAGYTIEEGTIVTIARAGDDLVGFAVVADVVIPPGNTETAAGEVILEAVEDGADANDLTADPVLQDSLDFVTGITQTSAETFGGVDEEDDADYLNRLVEELQLLSTRPILPRDFEIYARRHANVFRALGLDGYNPGDETFDNERYMTVAVVKEDGTVLSAGDKSDIDAVLEAERETNFIVNVIDPTYTGIDVTTTVVVQEGHSTTDVDAAVTAALEEYLSSATWGRTLGGEDQDWKRVTVVRYGEVWSEIDRVVGVDYVDSLTIGLDGGAMGVVNVNITGAAPLTQPADIAVTANAP